jgi:hypothetical protein
MLCPNCDSILNARGCLSCGWQRSDPWPGHRLAAGSANPLKPGESTYPPREIAPLGAPLVLKDFGKAVARPQPPMLQTVLDAGYNHGAAERIIAEETRKAEAGEIPYGDKKPEEITMMPEPDPEPDPEKIPTGYAVGKLADEDGNTLHVLVGPVPVSEGGGPSASNAEHGQAGVTGTRSASLPEIPIPDPLTKTVQ